MKGRDSGMPEEAYWESFFDAESVLDKFFGEKRIRGNLVEFGCGYGTFTLSAAKRTAGRMTALDIEPQMVACTQKKAADQAVSNVYGEVRDFVAHGTGLGNRTHAHAMIFNLLHLEQPVALLKEAYRILKPNGTLSVIHWRSDIPTPRGPSLDIRPCPEQCVAWIKEAGFVDMKSVDLQPCCPYHFGLIARR